MGWTIAWGWPTRGAETALAGHAAERRYALLAAMAVAVAAGPLLMSVGDEDAGSGAHRSSGVEASAPAETLYAAYGGVTHTHASDVLFRKAGVTDLTAHGVEWIGRPFKSPIYYGLRGMHWGAGGRFGGMVDFTHAKAISVREQTVRFSGTRDGKPADGQAKIGDTFRHLEFSHGHNMLTLNGLLRLAPMSGSLRPYVGAGVGLSLPHTEVQFLDETKRTYEYQMTGGVGQVVAGFEIRLPRASVIVEYKFSFAPYSVPLSLRDGSKGNAFVDYWVQFSRWWRGEATEGGWLWTNLASHHVIVGVGYRHAAGP